MTVFNALWLLLTLAAICGVVIAFTWAVDFYCDYFLNWEKDDGQ